MIAKRILTQKGFRLPETMVNDLEKIANLTGRSQNELVEYAIGDFIMDNVIYLIEYEILNLISTSSEEGFGKVFGDMLVVYGIDIDDKKESYINIDFYQLDEKTLALIESKSTKLDVMPKLKTKNIKCQDPKYFGILLHDALTEYNYNTKIMQEWFKKQYNY